MNRPGDWHCRSCQHLNFQRRESCQRCGESKFAREFSIFSNNRGRNLNLSSSSSSSSSFGGGVSPGSDVRPGDWYCNIGNCGTHNFASRSSCFKCGGLKDDYEMINRGVGSLRGFGFGSEGSRPGSSWKSGDWICTRSGCNEHNFASRMECFRCNAPRDSF